jgi:hypothetical protein
MSVIQWPDFVVSSFRWRSVEQQVVHRGPFGSQALASGLPVWEVELVGSPEYWKEAQDIEAFLESLKGYENQVALHNLTRPVPLGTMRGSMVLNAAAAQGATTLQIKSGDLGGELVANGTFDTDTSGWTASNATLAVDAGRLKVTGTDTTGAANGVAHQAIACVIGKTYKVSANLVVGVGSIGFGIGTTALGLETYFSGYSATTRLVETTFVATSTTHYVNSCVDTVDGTQHGFFDNITVKEVLYAGATLLKNDLIGLGSGLTQQVVKVAADAMADGFGVIGITITPPLRNAFAAGAAVTWDRPKALFRQKSLNEGIEYQPVIGQAWALSLREDWR